MIGAVLNEGPLSASAPRAPLALSIALVEASVRAARDSASVQSLRAMAAGLRAVSVRALSDRERLAFWINVYNALDRHAVIAENLRGNLLTKLGFFARAAYEIDGERCSLDVIEHGLLRANRRAPFALTRPLRSKDRRAQWGPSSVDPRVHFALNCGAKSCPPVLVFQPESVEAALREATREYFAQECSIDRDTRVVTLPFLLWLYGDDFGDRDATLSFVIDHLDRAEAEWLAANRSVVKLRFNRYDWTIVR